MYYINILPNINGTPVMRTPLYNTIEEAKAKANSMVQEYGADMNFGTVSGKYRAILQLWIEEKDGTRRIYKAGEVSDK